MSCQLLCFHHLTFGNQYSNRILRSAIFEFKSQDPLVGGSLLLTYTTGYVAPLLLAASFAGALQV